MRLGRVFLLLAFVLALGLVAVVVVLRFVLPRLMARPEPAAEATPTPRPVEILYITQNLSKGTVLDASMMAAIPWQESALVPGMFLASDIEAVVGRVLKQDVSAGMPLLDAYLLKEGEQITLTGSTWALNIPPSMVAVAVPFNRLAMVSYAPRPGDHVNVTVCLALVDVDTDFQSQLPNYTGLVVSAGPPNPETGKADPLTVGVASLGQTAVSEEGAPAAPPALSPGIAGKVTIDPVLGQALYLVPSEVQRPRYVCHIMLQDVIVLQVGNFPVPGQEVQPQATPTPEGGQAPEQGQAPPPPPDVVTLIVRPEDAVALNFVMVAQSKLAALVSLHLRNPNDTSRVNILPITLQFLLERYQIAVPARLPYSLNPRIDNVTFPGE